MNQNVVTEILEKAISKARELNVPITATVVDNGGHVRGVIRQENCSYFALDASLQKAVTASQMKIPSHVVGEISEKYAQLKNAFASNPQISGLPGGFPIIIHGIVEGGVGIAGGDFDQDTSIGQAASETTNAQ